MYNLLERRLTSRYNDQVNFKGSMDASPHSATRSTAADGVQGGTVSDDERRALAEGAAQAAAKALANDVANWLEAR